MEEKIKYEYFAFKKLYEEHDGNVSSIAMIMRTSRPRIYRMIDAMQRDSALITRAVKEREFDA